MIIGSFLSDLQSSPPLRGRALPRSLLPRTPCFNYCVTWCYNMVRSNVFAFVCCLGSTCTKDKDVYCTARLSLWFLLPFVRSSIFLIPIDSIMRRPACQLCMREAAFRLLLPPCTSTLSFCLFGKVLLFFFVLFFFVRSVYSLVNDGPYINSGNMKCSMTSPPGSRACSLPARPK